MVAKSRPCAFAKYGKYLCQVAVAISQGVRLPYVRYVGFYWLPKNFPKRHLLFLSQRTIICMA